MASTTFSAQSRDPTPTTTLFLPTVGKDLQNEKAWKEALDLCRKKFSSAKPDIVFQSTNPKDIRKYLDDVRQQQSKSKLTRSIRGIGTCMDALMRHEKAIGMFAQAGGIPGCVAWGCTRVVLELTQGYIKDYERLLKTLADISAWLEPVGFEAATFPDSPMVIRSLVALHVHIIEFWMKAYIAYSSPKPRKLLGAFKAIWTDYDVEFNLLKGRMENDLNVFLASATAAHHRQFDQFDQKFDKLILENRQATTHKDAVRWLAPPDDVPYGIDYYQRALSAAYSARQPGTCEWFLKQEKYLSWDTALPHSEQSFLWLTAIPGAGKSTLAAFVTSHHLDIGHKETFYFFFDSTNGYTANTLNAGKCLLYQLYMHARENGESSHFELQKGMESSGGSQAKSFKAVWEIALKYVGRLTNPVFIIDALDENIEPDSFLNALLGLVQKTMARVLLTSRPSVVPSAKDLEVTFMEFGSDQRDDIETYIQRRTTEGLTSLPQIRSTVVETLVKNNGGMFLWVRLVFEELESTHSLAAMELALKSLPTDLEGVYAKILRKLDNALKQSQRKFCHKILIWLCCARRSLTIKELFEAMKADYANQGFLYTRETFLEAIRAACGPLVIPRMDSIHLVHFSLKEFLTKSPAEWSAFQEELRDFHINTEMGSLQILNICLGTLENMASTENFHLWGDESTRVNPDISEMQSRWPLMEYSSFNWIYHARQSGLDESSAIQALRKFFECKGSIVWIYASLAMNITYLEELKWSIDSLLLVSFNIRLREDSTSSFHMDDTRMCGDWCKFVEEIFSRYGSTLEDNPGILFDLDLPSLAQETNFQPKWISELARKSCERRTLEQSFRLKPSGTIPAHRKLHIDVSEVTRNKWSGESDPEVLGLFRVIKRYGAFIYASHDLSGKPRLLIQECSTGRRLAPSTCDAVIRFEGQVSWDPGELALLDSAISEDETRVAVVYGSIGTYSFFTCVWHLKKVISFESDPFEAKWGEVIFHTTTFQPIFNCSAKLVVFASNDLLWCPAGLVDMMTGSITAFTIHMPDFLSKDDTPYPTYPRLTLYGKGDAFIFSRESRVRVNTKRISSTGTKIEDILPPDDNNHLSKLGPVDSTFYCNLFSTDESGRFIVWISSTRRCMGVVLHDTTNGNYVTLAGDVLTTLFVNNSKIAIFAMHSLISSKLELWTWDISSSGSGPSQIAFRDHFENFCGMCASADGLTLYLVTADRTITQLTLPDLLETEEYLSFRGQHEEVIQTFASADGGSIASIRSDETRVDVKIWDLQLTSECRNYYYQRNHAISKSSEFVLSPNFEWICFSNSEHDVFRVIEEGWALLARHSQRVDTNAAAEMEQDSPSQNIVKLNTERSTSLVDHARNADGRRFGYDHAHIYFSACGRYTIMAMDSCQDQTNAQLLLWSIGTKPREHAPWNIRRIANAEVIGFQDAKISVNFDTLNPVCFLTFWTKPDTDKAICTVHCFVLNLTEAVITHHLQSVTLSLDSDHLSPSDQIASSFYGSTSRAWISQMDMMERSVALSKCGQYLVLSTIVGPERYRWTVDLTPHKNPESKKNENPESNPPTNPGVIEPKIIHWRQHRYWTSVYRQRILLHRSVRSAADPDSFSSLSCHVQLSVLPAHLADAKVWLLVPNSNDADMTVLVTTQENPLELWKLQVSWNMIEGKLKGLEAKHEKAIVALSE